MRSNGALVFVGPESEVNPRPKVEADEYLVGYCCDQVRLFALMSVTNRRLDAEGKVLCGQRVLTPALMFTR